MSEPINLHLLGREVEGTDDWSVYRFPFSARIYQKDTLSRYMQLGLPVTFRGELLHGGNVVTITDGDDPEKIAKNINTWARELWAESKWYDRTEE